MKAASLVLSLIVAAPYGAATAAPPAPPAPAAPTATAPPTPASPSLYGPPPGAASPPAPPPAASPPAASPAQPWLGPPSEAPPATASLASPPEEKSVFVAVSLSFSMPIAAILAGAYLLDDSKAGETVILVAAIAGPSTGWLYAGRPLHGLATAATRLIGGVLMVRVLDDSASAGSDDGLILFGTAAFVAATLVDWIGAPRAVLMDNARARATIVPTAPSGGGVGLSLVGSF